MNTWVAVLSMRAKVTRAERGERDTETEKSAATRDSGARSSQRICRLQQRASEMEKRVQEPESTKGVEKST